MEELNRDHAAALRLVAAGAVDQARARDIDWCYKHGLVEFREEYPGASHWVLTPKGEELLPGLEVFEALSGGQGRWRLLHPFSDISNAVEYAYDYEHVSIRLTVDRTQLGPSERFRAQLSGDGLSVLSSLYVAESLVHATRKAIDWATTILHERTFESIE